MLWTHKWQAKKCNCWYGERLSGMDRRSKSPNPSLNQSPGIQSLSYVWLLATPWTAAPRLPCPPLSPRVSSDSCRLNQCCYLTILYSAVPFFLCLQSFPASGSFPVNWLCTSDGQSIGASVSVLPVNIQGWFPLGWMVWSPCSPWDSQESSLSKQFKSINSSVFSHRYGPTHISIHD